MKAIAVKPQEAFTHHLRDIDKPSVADVPDGKGVLVRCLKVGVDATDKEIIEGYYGDAPPDCPENDKHLVIGHECFGRVRGWSQRDPVCTRRLRNGDCEKTGDIHF